MQNTDCKYYIDLLHSVEPVNSTLNVWSGTGSIKDFVSRSPAAHELGGTVFQF